MSAPFKILVHPHITLMNMFHEHFSYVSTFQNIGTSTHYFDEHVSQNILVMSAPFKILAHPHISLINMFHKHFSYVSTFQNIFTSISFTMKA